MAQGIRKGSPEAKQFLDKTLTPHYKGIESSDYTERAKVGGEFLQSLFTKKELQYFQKTELKQIEKELKQREAQDQTRTIAATEHKAETMLNAFKSNHNEGPFIKGALRSLEHIQAVFKGINPADIQVLKNPLLQNLASLACGHNNKKNAAAAFASQVLQNPTYLFSDQRQAKLFLSRFLRQQGLGSLSRLLRRRGERAHKRVMAKIEEFKGAFDRSVMSLSAKKRLQKAFLGNKPIKIPELVPQMKKGEITKLPPSEKQKAQQGSGLTPVKNENRDSLPAEVQPNVQVFAWSSQVQGSANPSRSGELAQVVNISPDPVLPGTIPLPPPLPMRKKNQSHSQAPVAAEGIKALKDLIPVKPADNHGKLVIEKCKVAPKDIDKVLPDVFKELTIDHIQAFSLEQLASLTDQQQRAVPVEVINRLVARAVQAPAGLSPEQREARSVARKALACLDPKLVKETLENSQNHDHKLYIKPKAVQDKQTDDLSIAYKDIRRDIFKTPYKPGEKLSRLTLEQLAELKAKQQATSGANPQSLFEQIQAGKTLRKTGDKPSLDQTSGDKTQTTEEKGPSVGGGGTFNSKLLDKTTQGQPQSSRLLNTRPLEDIPESSDEDWDDEVEEEQDANTPEANPRTPPVGSMLQEPASTEVNNPPIVNLNSSPDEPKIEKSPELVIAEAAAQAVQVKLKQSDIQKHPHTTEAVQKAVEAMTKARTDEKMPELSEVELNRLSAELESTAIAFYREKKSEYAGTLSRAAKAAAHVAAAEAVASGKSQEEAQIIAQQAAQGAAEKALIEAVCKAVEEHNNTQISALIKHNSMGNRRRFIEDRDDEEDDDWD